MRKKVKGSNGVDMRNSVLNTELENRLDNQTEMSKHRYTCLEIRRKILD